MAAVLVSLLRFTSEFDRSVTLIRWSRPSRVKRASSWRSFSSCVRCPRLNHSRTENNITAHTFCPIGAVRDYKRTKTVTAAMMHFWRQFHSGKKTGSQFLFPHSLLHSSPHGSGSLSYCLQKGRSRIFSNGRDMQQIERLTKRSANDV